MSLSAAKPPMWVWPARAVGLALFVLGILLPGVAVWRHSRQAMPAEQVVPLKELRPPLMVLPPGKFLMGSSADDQSADSDEHPQHEVEITRRFGISETEVTQRQYEGVMGVNPSFFKDRPDHQRLPVENVSWLEAVAYCNKLSDLEGLERCYQVSGEQVEWKKGVDCKGYRLSTEAEWEYAARADEGTQYAGSNRADDVAWYGEDLEKGAAHPVKGKKPNQWGLYDMSGNVYEWVWDWHAPYPATSQKDPVGPLQDGSNRVIRGGSWDSGARGVRVAIRFRYAPGIRNRYVGFRLVRSYP